jgi:serine protease Do
MNADIRGGGDAFSIGTTALADRLARSVVEVRGHAFAVGAGLLWGGPELIITNAHCVQRGVAPGVRVANGPLREARVLAHDPRRDLALLGVDGIVGAMLELRDADTLRAGELVFAHGHPHGVSDSVAMGVIHGVSRDPRTNAPRWIVADVRLAPGNSGGPLVDAEGRLVGINSMVVNGLGVAIPAEAVRQFVDRTLARRAA